MAREQALVEAMRELESVTAAAAREKAALLAQIAALEGRVRQLEEEDVRFLELLLDALRKLAPPEKKP